MCGKGTGLLPLRWLTQDIGYLAFYIPRWNARPIVGRTDLIISAGAYICLALISLPLALNLFVALLVGWLIPARIALFVLVISAARRHHTEKVIIATCRPDSTGFRAVWRVRQKAISTALLSRGYGFLVNQVNRVPPLTVSALTSPKEMAALPKPNERNSS